MQTILSPDGRRIMIGWMQNWDTIGTRDERDPWFGQMSLPREIRLKDGRLYQWPIKELENYRHSKVEYRDVRVEGNGVITSAYSKPKDVTAGLSLPGVSGRCLDMEVTVSSPEGQELFNKFTITLAADEEYHTKISFRPQESIVKIDRKFSGSRRAVIHQRRAQAEMENGQITFRIILDRYSMEVFINGGSKVMTATLGTRLSADGIYFASDKDAVISVTKYAIG